jgi:hypothetical protein
LLDDDDTVFPELEDLVGGGLESEPGVSASISLPIILASDDENIAAAAGKTATKAAAETTATAAAAPAGLATRPATTAPAKPAAAAGPVAGPALNAQGTTWSKEEKLYLIESWKMHWFEYNEKDLTNNRKGEINNAIFNRHCLRFVLEKRHYEL